MRLALAQINTVVGDLDGNRALILARLERGARGGRRPRPLPRARGHRLPARGPAAAAGLRPRRRALARGDRARGAWDRRARRHASLRRATSTTRAPSAPTARCRRSTASASCPNYGVFDEERYFAPGRDLLLLALGEALVGADGLRGHLAARAARDRPGARRRAADRQHLGVAVPRRQGARARGDVRDARPRQLVLRRVRATPSAARTS